jgi:replicative DNA helicase
MAKNITSLLCNYAAEREVLSACLQEDNIYTALAHRLSADMFTDEECRKVWRIMQTMSSEGKRPELTEVGMRLLAQGGDIREFMSVGASYMVTSQRIDLLLELAQKRRLCSIANKIIAKVSNPSVSYEEVQSVVEELGDVVKENEPTVLSFAETLTALQNHAAARLEGDTDDNLLTGLHLLDQGHGFHTGDLVIIAAETSQGKSSLATTIARNMAIEGIPSAYYSLEMAAQQLAARIVARDTLIASARVLYGKLDEDEFTQFFDTTVEMKKLPIFFDENSKTSFGKLCTSIRAMVRTHGIRVAFVDYLQILANSGQNDNREQIIGDMARSLKRLAVEENVCIVALSQLNRSAVSKEPTINRLRGSGQIEEAADMVVLINRKDSFAKLYIAKNRNGALGDGTVKFNQALTFFEDCEAEPIVIKHPWE